MAVAVKDIPLEDTLGLPEGLRIFLIILTVIIILVALAGNSTILYSSLAKGAVKMEAIDLVQVYNNAVCDILLMLLFFLPVLLTLFYDRYVLGETWCVITAYFIPNTPMIYMILVNAFGTVLRVWMLNKPPLVRTRFPVRRMYWVMAGCAAVAVFSGLLFPILKNEEIFVPGRLSCTMKIVHDGLAITLGWFLYTVLLVAAPLVVLVSANIYAGTLIAKTLKHSRTTTKEQKCRVCLTIQSICWSFILSYLPIIVVHMVKLSGYKFGERGYEPTWCILPTYCLSIASLTNPFILYISNVKFREYINSLVRGGGAVVKSGKPKVGDSEKDSSCKMVKQSNCTNDTGLS